MHNQPGICLLSQIPMRGNAAESSEMVNQLIFGDSYIVLDQTEKWLHIRTDYDQYQGWIDAKLFVAKENNTNNSIAGINIEVLGRAFLSDGSSFLIPFGANLEALNQVPLFSYFSGKYLNPSQFLGIEQLESMCTQLLHAPYLWGGKTALGIDCSGFSQLVYKTLGIHIPRDASQQVEKGRDINFIEEAKEGDLAFFTNDEGKIVHVGIILSNNRIIHASGTVRIDLIDHNGIFNKSLKKYTHQLKITKRYL
jgi:gamma-D-glutamyl-L-lysine dipeptidyl-peptidase